MNNSTPSPGSVTSFTVTYHFVPPEGSSPEAFALGIAQEHAVAPPLFEHGIVGNVVDVAEVSKKVFRTVITYHSTVRGFTIAQFTNLLSESIAQTLHLRIVTISLFGDEMPEPDVPASPEQQSTPFDPPASGLLPFDEYTWQGRTAELYKVEGSTGFTGITRTELIGKNGTRTAFDLRYFEIEAGGYSTFEKHLHEQVIIGVRGSGFLIKGHTRIPITPHDIGYIGPNVPHQLQNLSAGPFGFYCIVDHDRDEPQEVDVEDE